MGDSDDNKSGCLIDNNDIGNEGKMFVGGLSKSTTVEGMREYFDKFGAVKDVVVKMDPNTQQSRGFGFVMFVNEESIDGVLQGGPHNLDGKRIDPKKAERRDGKMFIGGVKPETTDETIKSYFVAFGAVETVDRPINKQTNENKPFVFVTFKKDGVVGKCIKQRYHEIDGKRCEAKEGVAKDKMQPQGGHYPGNQGGWGGGAGPQYGGYPQQFGGQQPQWGQQQSFVGGYGQWGGHGGPLQSGPPRGRGGGRGGGRGRGAGQKFAPY